MSALFRVAVVSGMLWLPADAEPLGETCTRVGGRRRGSCSKVWQTRSGCLVRSEDQCSGWSQFDAKEFFDKCDCDPSAPTTAAPTTVAPEANTAKCGILGGPCVARRHGCHGEGICLTKNGCSDRNNCSGSNGFDASTTFDECTCPPRTDAASATMKIIFVAMFLGLCCICGGSSKFIDDDKMLLKNIMRGAVLIPAFYSIPPFAMSMAGEGNSILNDFAMVFVLIILVVFTIFGPCLLNLGKEKLPVMILVFCAAAGLFAFTFSIVLLCLACLLLFGLVSLSIKCTFPSEEEGGPSEEDGGRKEQDSTEKSAVVVCTQSLFGFFMRFVNFVMQVGLIAYSFADVEAIKDRVTDQTSIIKDHLKLVLEQSFDFEVPLVADILKMVAVLSSFLNDAADHISVFLLGFTATWTPDMVTAYISVGVFEVAVIFLVFTIVLSDMLLIVSPREGEGLGCVGQLVGDFVSRSILYALQVLVSASHAFVFALIFVKPIQRATVAESGLGSIMFYVGVPLTALYVMLAAALAMYILAKLWSGSDASLQNVAVQLLEWNGVIVPDVVANASSPCAFFFAFFGYWSQDALDAFEVKQRTRIYKLEEDEVLLATVNALSFPFYILPFGAFVAKLGEYLNQSPLYVASRGFSIWGTLVWLTYLAEYGLVLFVAKGALDTIEAEPAEHRDVKEAAAEAGNSTSIPLLGICSLAVITAIRTAITTGRRKWRSRGRGSGEGSGEGSEEVASEGSGEAKYEENDSEQGHGATE